MTVVKDVDPYVERWAGGVGAAGGLMPGTWLDPIRDRCYVVVLAPGISASRAYELRPAVAARLEVDRDQLIFTTLAPRDLQLRIVDADAIRGSEYYTCPRVSDGMIRDLGGHLDGEGAFAVRMWDAAWPRMMRSVAIVGGASTGRTSAAGTLAVGALSTNVMSLLYVDPKGTRENVLSEAARVALIGLEAAEQAPVVVEALVRGRLRYLADTGLDVLGATPALPGWAIVHDDFDVVGVSGRGTRAWERVAWYLDRLGFWPVAVSHSFSPAAWGSEIVRQLFADQVVAFHTPGGGGDVVGLRFPQRELPAAPDGSQVGGAVQNAAALGNSGRPHVPGFWRHLPVWSTTDSEAPLCLADALREYTQQVELAAVDVESLTGLLGLAVDGRWVLGPGGTHPLPRP